VIIIPSAAGCPAKIYIDQAWSRNDKEQHRKQYGGSFQSCTVGFSTDFFFRHNYLLFLPLKGCYEVDGYYARLPGTTATDKSGFNRLNFLLASWIVPVGFPDRSI
jgi:hypothetical protein